MKLWRLLVWTSAALVLAVLAVAVTFMPFFIGFGLLAMCAWVGADALRLRTGSLDRALLASDLADLLELGVPLDEAAQRLDGRIKGDWRTSFSPLARAWAVVPPQLARGTSLARALAAIRYFPRVWCQSLAAAETTERVPAVLRSLAVLERVPARRTGTWRTSRWALVLVFVMGVLFFLTTYIWPTFVTLYEGIGVSLPEPMPQLIYVVKNLRNPAVMIPTMLVVLLLGFALSQVRWLHPVRTLQEQARLAEGLALGVELGLSVPRTLELASHACSGHPQSCLRARAREAGDRLGQALARDGLLPRPWLWLVDQAEARGELAEALHLCSRRLFEDSLRLQRTLAVITGQVALAGLGLLVGMAVIGTLVTITDLTSYITEVY